MGYLNCEVVSNYYRYTVKLSGDCVIRASVVSFVAISLNLRTVNTKRYGCIKECIVSTKFERLKILELRTPGGIYFIIVKIPEMANGN